MLRTILITGANRGIGLALTAAFLDRGARVVATARQPARSDALAALKARFPKTLELATLDVADGASVATLPEALAAAGVRALDALVNNAGTIGPKRQSSEDMDFDGFAETLAVNTLGPLRVTQAVLPLLRRGDAPRILTLTSAMGSMSHARSDRIAYRASKAAVNKVMQALSTDLRPAGIAVAVAHPGWVRTDMGGAGADVAPHDSARGLIAIIDGLTLQRTGGFYNWTGETLPF